MRGTVSSICIAMLAASAWAQPAHAARSGVALAASAAAAASAQPRAAQDLPPAARGPASAASAADKPAEVRVGDTLVFTLRAARSGLSAATRARAANAALREALRAQPAEVHVEQAEGYAVVYVGTRPVVQLTAQDALLAGDSGLGVHADRVAAEIGSALAAERSRSAVAGAIFNSSLAVLFAVLAVFLLRRAWQLAERAGRWLAAHPEQVPALHLRTIELLNPATVRTALRLALAAGRWIVLLGLAYAWLIATLSLFEATRGFTGELSGALLVPLATLAARSAAALPLAVVVALALAALALVLRAVRLFFGEVARGAARVAWLPQDLAAVTGVLVELALVIAALLLVAPVITGNDDGAAPRIGLLLLAAVALAAVPLAASAAVGAVTLFGRRLVLGDWVELGARSGRVLRLGLLDTTLRDGAGVETRVPHLAALWHATRVHGAAPRVTAALVVERALATREVAARLERALAALGREPAVQLVEVRATHATLVLGLTSAAADAHSACLFAALAELDRLRAEGGVA